MLRKLRQILTTSLLDNTERDRIVSETRTMVIAGLVFTAVCGLPLVITSRNLLLSTAIVGYILLLEFLAIIMLRWGKPKIAGFFFVFGVWSGLTVTAAISGGLNSPAVASLMLVMVAIGYLQSGVTGVIFAGLALVSLVVLYFAGSDSWLPDLSLSTSPGRLLLFQLVNLALSIVSIYFIILRTKRSFETIRIHELDLEKRNEELREIRNTLEQRVTERTAEITRQKKYFEALVQNSPLAVVMLDLSHRIVSCNQAFENLFGYSLAEMLGRDLDEFVADQSTVKEAKVYTEMAKQGKNVYAIARRRRKDGASIDVEIYGVPVMVDDEQVGILGLYNNITERLRAREALEESEVRFRSFFEHASIGLFIADLQGRFTQVNRALAEMLGYPAEELLASTVDQITYSKDLKIGQQEMHKLLEREVEFFQVEKRLVHKMGWAIWVLLNSSLLTDRDGTPIYLIGQVQDITSRKETEKRLEYLATHDHLTGLPNRSLFLDRLDHAIKLAQRRLTRVAVLFLDLNSFKLVNDNFGHDIGDHVLQALGSRMVACLRKSDSVARIGGDEFAFIVENISDHESIVNVVEKISAAIMEPIVVDSESFRLIPSIGVALFPEDGRDIKTLMIAADKAMYRARESSKNGYGFAWGEKTKVRESKRL